MEPNAIVVFRELADRSAPEREEYYVRHNVPSAIRAEVESLLRYDRATVDSLHEHLAAAARAVVGMHPVGPGARLGPYEVLARVGAGGMGEVYKARDSRLDRTVAIKILPPEVAGHPDLNQRFAREARMLAALSHPHICPVFDVGHQDDTAFLVMEYLDGETLASRLARSALPLDQALRFAIQIADALATAHATGIVHRDLKPGNIMLTSSGAKLLDFGLAKPARPALGNTWSQLPTSLPITDRGTILGTFQYMAPEQLEGGEADARSDIFAFGAVVYEMVTGRKAFEGRNPISVIAAILQADPPPLSVRQPLAPPLLDHVVKTCLAKNAGERWQSIADAMRELTWIAGEGNRAVSTPPQRRPAKLAWIVAAVSVVTAAAAVAGYLAVAPRDTPAVRFFVSPPETTSFPNVAGFFSMSPDGRSLAFATESSGKRLLWLRPLDAIAARPLSGTEGAVSPFWSPDSRFVAFYADGKLKTINISDGTLRSVCNVPDGFGRGGAWSQRGVIVFPLNAVGPLYRVSASGGTPTAATTLDASKAEQLHTSPSFLPDGTHFLYSAQASADRGGVFLASLDSKEVEPLLGAHSNALYTSGHLLYGVEGALMAQRFDVQKRRLRGEPFSLADRVLHNPILWRTAFSASDTGVLAYRGTGAAGDRAALTSSQLRWFDRTGKPSGSIGEGAEHANINLSPDGTKIAIDRRDPHSGNWDIWVIDVSRGTTSRVTRHPTPDTYPIWSPDGARIAFASSRDAPQGGHDSVYLTPSTGSSDEQQILGIQTGAVHQHPRDWSPDGRYVLVDRIDASSKSEVWILPLSGARTPFPFARTEFSEVAGRFSPDGRFVAYASNETGRFEVYIRPFGSADGKWQISVNGGGHPIWSRSGREIFYISPESTVMMVPVKTKPRFDAGAPSKLFDLRLRFFMPGTPDPYAVSPDGQRFLVMPASDALNTPLTVTVNWPALRSQAQ